MTAVDSAFDSPIETVTAGFAATQIGENTVCVRGTDTRGNVSESVCVTFNVQYVFTGFTAPVDNDAVNIALAGKTIPVKWPLTDGTGMPISDPASFVGLYSYSVSCIDFTGEPTDVIEEYAAGASGLHYIGDGYWQYNWKTPKTYAGQCRKAYIKFADGMTSPHAKFKFQ